MVGCTLTRKVSDPNASAFYTRLISFPIFLILPPVKESFPSLGIEQGYYLRSYYKALLRIPEEEEVFDLQNLQEVDANFEPIEHENYAYISNVCYRGLLHIMCGYQCDKAVDKNDTREVI